MPPTSAAIQPLCLKLNPGPGLVERFVPFLEQPYPAFLDSLLPVPGLGRYSYLTADPFLVLRSKGPYMEIERDGCIERREGNPFVVLQGLMRQFRLSPLPGLLPFQGGAIGYLAYELAHHLERLPHRARDDLGLPEMQIAFYDWVIAHDHAANSTWAIASGFPEGTPKKAQERLDWVCRLLEKGTSDTAADRTASLPLAEGLRSSFSQTEYMAAVRRVKEYLAQGDVYQVNLSQRFEAKLLGSPWELYLRLRHVSPAPFGAYLGYPQVAVLSASPEQFLHLADGEVRTRPMKGTRPRGRTPTEDQELSAQLLASEKDRAENLMIVDLLRNDLGKVCTVGSVQVPELFAIEKYPHVYQMVSAVQGRLRPELDAVDLLQACFPGGSVTGAPKIRAMEIIDELEPTQRSVYCGALGYIGFDGSMLTAIPIRILLAKGSRVYFQVGGGIVADSDPLAEYEETLHKARGSMLALGLGA